MAASLKSRPGKATPARFPDPRHDHAACVAHALDAAEALCASRRERLTAIRRQVLEIVWRGHHPIGAYDILEAMQIAGGRKVAPPTVYRALEFLRQQGFVHRIESLNAFVGCHDPGQPHAVQFMICRECRTAVEIHDPRIADALAAAAESAGFTAQERVVELSGLCRRCAGLRGGSPARA
jgi:Fur family transcriptional regulator, zinc uptake regulator